MNEELQNFLVKITTEGFADLKTSLNETNKMLEDIDKNFSKSTKSGDNFFGALVKWTGLVGGLTAAFVVLKNTIRGVFDTAYDVADLYQQEQLLGVEARVLEQYGIVAQRNRGSQADAYTFFNDVNELMGRFRTGKINQNDMEKFARLGIGFQYSAGQSLSENRDRYLNDLHRAVSKMDLNNAEQVSIMKELIKPQSMQTLFMANDEQFAKQMAWGDKWRVLSRDSSDLQNAQDLITVQMEWKQTLTEFKIQLMPLLTKVLQALEPLIPVIRDKITLMGDWIDKNADKIAGWVEDAVDWLLHDFKDTMKEVWTTLKAIAGALGPIVEWVVNRLGGTFKSMWDTGKMMWADLTGDPDRDKKWAEFDKKYLSEGSTAGGYFGDYLRWVAGVPTTSGNTSNITNNSPTYVIKGDSYFPKDVKLNANGPTGAMLAHYASSVKG